jgi:glycosyltransferase involved in cell wall biosynthesis
MFRSSRCVFSVPPFFTGTQQSNMLSTFLSAQSRSFAAPVADRSTAVSKLLVFELSVGGHYPSYIQHLITYWQGQNLPGILYVLVTPQFLLQHQDVVDLVQGRTARSQVIFQSISGAEAASLADRTSKLGRLRRNFQEWRLLQKYTKRLEIDHAFIPYLDTRFLPIALGQSLSCKFSGIYFRPTWHYSKINQTTSGIKTRIKNTWSKLVLQRILANRQFTQLFCLDPLAVDQLKHWYKGRKTRAIADPVQQFPANEVRAQFLKRQMGIESHRRVFLLFGAINDRKGIYQLLDALEQLPSQELSQVCILIVGSMADATDADRIRSRIDHIQQSCAVQLIHVEDYVPEVDIQHYFNLSDVVLAIYQRHVGMSGILVRAAIAQKPVLSSNYGLMGAITKRHGLGVVVDSTQPWEIAWAMSHLLTEGLESVGDRRSMAAFGEQNSPHSFAQTVFSTLWPQYSTI